MAARAVPKVWPRLTRVFPAGRAAPALVRRVLRAWLSGLDVPVEDGEDLVLAVDEAVTNVVDHAYATFDEAGPVVLDAKVEPRTDGLECVVVTVSDSGRWRPVPKDPGYRGRGLRMMRVCADSWRLESDASGTRVTLATGPI